MSNSVSLLAADSKPARRAWRLRPALLFAVGYGVVTGIASIPGALLLRGGIDADLAKALALFAAGAALAAFATALAIAWLLPRSPGPARFSAAVVLLILLTAGFDTILLYADYISHYVEWWPPAFSRHWFFTASTTFAGVGYYYVTLGVPMLLPFGMPVLLGAAVYLARR